MRPLFIFFFVIYLLLGSLLSQENTHPENDSKAARKAHKDTANFRNAIIPLAFYLPETGFAIGGTGIATFRFKGESKESRPSQFFYSAAYTLKKQVLLFLPYELYRQEMKYRLKGELGFYKYFYNYFGLGADSRLEARETYDVVFPRFELSAFKRVHPAIFVGAGYKFDYFNIRAIKDSGLLASNQPIGVAGGTKSNFLVNVLFDNRDNIFSTSEGLYVDALFEISRPAWGSDYGYHKLTLDARYFQPIGKKWVLASQFVASSASPDAPFFDLPYLSTSRYGRGFSDRRFVDYKLLNAQTELRFPLFWRLGGTTFISASSLGAQWAMLSDPKLTAGLGLRFTLNEKEKTKIRVDAGFSGEEFNFYITANEAF